MNICQAVVSSLEFESQPPVIDSEAMKNCRVEVVYVYRVFHNVVAIVVGDAERRSRLDTSASQPH